MVPGSLNSSREWRVPVFEFIQWPGGESDDLMGGNLKSGCGVRSTGTHARKIISRCFTEAKSELVTEGQHSG